MGQWQLKHAVKMRNEMCGKRPLLEASGGITLNNVLTVASCGVDRIAVGRLRTRRWLWISDWTGN
jgi:nicotinate-nucleotide pyrophosphorylase (carboxylating)